MVLVLMQNVAKLESLVRTLQKTYDCQSAMTMTDYMCGSSPEADEGAVSDRQPLRTMEDPCKGSSKKAIKKTMIVTSDYSDYSLTTTS